SLLRRNSERVMIWLFTRATISSTTCPAAKAGISEMPMSIKSILFIRFPVGRHAAWACGRRVGYGRWGILLLQDREIPPEISVFDALFDLGGCSGTRLSTPHEGKVSHVIHDHGRTGELANRTQNRPGNGLGTLGGLSLKAFLHAFQAEFQIFRFFVFAVAFHHSARNQKKNCTFLQAHSGSLAGGMGEKAKRQAG